MKELFFLPLLLIITTSACQYDIEENLYPTIDCVTTNVSYISDVKPIITISCLVCHSEAENQGFVVLENHKDILKYAKDGSLVGSISHKSGWSSMPKSASKLDVCKIETITAWVNEGALDN